MLIVNKGVISLVRLTKYFNYIASQIYQIKLLCDLCCTVMKDLLTARIDTNLRSNSLLHSYSRAFLIGPQYQITYLILCSITLSVAHVVIPLCIVHVSILPRIIPQSTITLDSSWIFYLILSNEGLLGFWCSPWHFYYLFICITFC